MEMEDNKKSHPTTQIQVWDVTEHAATPNTDCFEKDIRKIHGE